MTETFIDLKYKTLLLLTAILLSSSVIFSAGSFLSPDEGENPDMITVIIHPFSIVVNSAEDLPDWGSYNDYPELIEPHIVFSYLSSNPLSRIDPEWEFEWAPEEAEDPADYDGGPQTGYGEGEWRSFSGRTLISIPSDTGMISVREVLKEGYLNFAGLTDEYPPAGSAQLYAHTDAYKYDNLERIYAPSDGETYFMVAFNLPLK